MSIKISPPLPGRQWPAPHTQLSLRWQGMLGKDLLNGPHTTMAIIGHLHLRCSRRARTLATSSITGAASDTHPHRRSTVTHLFRILNQPNSLHLQRSHMTLNTKRTTKEGTPRCHLLCTLICLPTTIGKVLLQHHNSDQWINMRRLQIPTMATTQGTPQIRTAILLHPQIAALRSHNNLTVAMGAPQTVCSSRNYKIVILPHICRNLRQTVISSRPNSFTRLPLRLTRG